MTTPVPAPRERRRYPRYPIALPIILVHGSRRIRAVTEDISHGGVFVRTDPTVPERQLVQIEVELWPAYRRTFHAVIVRRVRPGEVRHRHAGLGLQLYAVDHEHRMAWSKLVDRAMATCTNPDVPRSTEHDRNP